jgi:uncharacterized protein (TIRG00374 family)
MLNTPGFLSRKSVSIMLVGLVAFIVYLFFFGDFQGFLTLLSTLDLRNYALFYSLAIFALVLAVLFDSLIWYYLLDALAIKIRFRRIILYNWIGNFVEMVIPCQTVCGEATRIYLAQREPKTSLGVSSATVVSSRILSTFVYTTGLIVGFAALALTHQVPPFLLGVVSLIIAGTIIVLGMIFYVVYKEGAAEKIVKFLTKIVSFIIKRPSKLEREKDNIQKTIYSFTEAFQTYRKNPRLLAKPALFAVVAWIFNLLVYLMVFYSLGFSEINILDLATIYCVASTVETLTAGFPVGAVEITLISMFSLYGVPIAVAAAATALTRLLTFWCQVLIGYPLVNFVGLKSSVTHSMKKGVLTTSKMD